MATTDHRNDLRVVNSVRTVAADGALAIAPIDKTIILLSSTTGAKAATLSDMHNDQRVEMRLDARSGGSYTVAATKGGSAGTVTLDAADEGVVLAKTGGTVYVVQLLGTASFA